MHDDTLLQPSLEPSAGALRVFSERASFFVAFFGGPLALLAFTGLNSHFLGRLKKDLWLIGLCFAMFLTACYLVYDPPSGVEPLVWAKQQQRENPVHKHMPRAIGLAFWAIFFLSHRPFLKAAAFDDNYRSPWIPALCCAAAGWPLTIGVVIGMLFLRA